MSKDYILNPFKAPDLAVPTGAGVAQHGSSETASGRIGARGITQAQSAFVERLDHYKELLGQKLPQSHQSDRLVRLLSDWTSGDLAAKFAVDAKPGWAFKRAMDDAFKRNLKAIIQIQDHRASLRETDSPLVLSKDIKPVAVLHAIDKNIVDNDDPLTPNNAQELISVIQNADKSIWDEKTKKEAEKAIKSIIQCFAKEVPVYYPNLEAHGKTEKAWRKAQNHLQDFGDRLLKITANPDPEDLLAHTRGMVANGNLDKALKTMEKHYAHAPVGVKDPDLQAITSGIRNACNAKQRVKVVSTGHEEGLKYLTLGGFALFSGSIAPGLAAMIAGASIAGGAVIAGTIGASTLGIGLGVVVGVVGLVAGAYAIYRLGRFIHGKWQAHKLQNVIDGDPGALKAYRKKHADLQGPVTNLRLQRGAKWDLMGMDYRLAAKSLLEKVREERASIEGDTIRYTPAVKLLLNVYEPEELPALLALDEKAALENLGEHFNTYF